MSDQGAQQETVAPLLTLEEDAINKIDAGAQLIYALYGHPKAKELLTGEFATQGLIKAYMRAMDAYGVGSH